MVQAVVLTRKDSSPLKDMEMFWGHRKSGKLSEGRARIEDLGMTAWWTEVARGPPVYIRPKGAKRESSVTCKNATTIRHWQV